MAILFFLLINIISLNAEGLFFSELDFGDVPVGINNQPYIRTLPYTIVNNTDDVYYLEHMLLNKNYPDSISDKGNTIGFKPGHIFQFVNGPVRIDPRDSFSIPVAYTSSFVDDISKNGGKLSKSVNFYYRLDGSDWYFEDSVKIYARSIQNRGVESWGAYRNIRSCYAGIGNSESFESITILNGLDSNLKLDSVAITIVGNNLKPIGMSKIFSKEITSDSIIYSNDFSRYFFNFKLNSFETSKAIATFYLSILENPEKKYVIKDSVIFNVVENQQEGFISLVNRSFAEYVGKSISTTFFVSECMDTSLLLDSVFVKPDYLYEEFNFSYPSELPILMDNLGVKRIGTEFIAKNPGNRYGKICAQFRKSDGEIIIRCLDITISVITPSSIKESERINSPFLIYPQPANDVLNIKSNSELLNKIDLIKLYDIYGSIVYQSTSTVGDFSIPVSSISSGMYFLQIQASGNIYNYKIPVSR